jgi:hypothetical protein
MIFTQPVGGNTSASPRVGGKCSARLGIRSSVSFRAVLAVAAITFGTAATDAGRNDLSHLDSLRYNEILRCGSNSLYLFMLLSGHSSVTFVRLEEITASSEGVSLLTLRDVARELGVRAEIRHYRHSEVGRMPLPAITQSYASLASVTPLHFDVIYKVDSGLVYLLNGTTGERFSVQRSELPQFWTGFALTEDRWLGALFGMQSWPFIVALCMLAIDTALIVMWYRRGRGRGLNGGAIVSETEVLHV